MGGDRRAATGMRGLIAPPGPRAPQQGGMFITPREAGRSLGLDPNMGIKPAEDFSGFEPGPNGVSANGTFPGEPVPLVAPRMPPGPRAPQQGGGMPRPSLLPSDMKMLGESQALRGDMKSQFIQNQALLDEGSIPPDPQAGGGAGGSRTVQQGEMAYNIAKQMLGPNAGHQQIMALVQALAAANPDAFYGGDKLRAGATLNTNIPMPPPGPRMGTQGPGPGTPPGSTAPALSPRGPQRRTMM